MMSQMVPSYAAGGQEMASSLAELDFSILSDCQVPSPTSLPTYERSPPHLFGSPPRDWAPEPDWECRYPGACSPAGGALSPPLLIKQELTADSCLSLADMADEVGRTPHSPLSDGGYSSQGGSPGYQPASPPAPGAVGFQPASPPAYTAGYQRASPPPGYAAAPSQQDHQLLRQCLREPAQQPAAGVAGFGLELLNAGAQSGSGWMLEQLDSVFDLALEQLRQEKKNVCRLLGIAPEPLQWSADQVRAWVVYTCQQYGLAPPPDWLTMDGRTLCSLSEHQLKMYAPQCGETLWAQLELWRSAPGRPGGPLPWAIKQEPVQQGGDGAPVDPATAADSDDEDDQVAPARGGTHIHLWQFLKELLTHPQLYGSSIRWIDRQKGIFKIEDSVRVAKLWGKRKNRPAMNYDKLSRSIRQYYKKGMMKKTERSQRLVYQFCHPYSL